VRSSTLGQHLIALMFFKIDCFYPVATYGHIPSAFKCSNHAPKVGAYSAVLPTRSSRIATKKPMHDLSIGYDDLKLLGLFLN
jgi:hypothetical protein